MPHYCLYCNKKRITYRFAICADCEKIVGNKATNWPEWLRFLWNDVQRQRRQDIKIAAREVPLEKFEPEDGDNYDQY